jgi:hypothetical protein
MRVRPPALPPRLLSASSRQIKYFFFFVSPLLFGCYRWGGEEQEWQLSLLRQNPLQQNAAECWQAFAAFPPRGVSQEVSALQDLVTNLKRKLLLQRAGQRGGHESVTAFLLQAFGGVVQCTRLPPEAQPASTADYNEVVEHFGSCKPEHGKQSEYTNDIFSTKNISMQHAIS